MKSVEIIPGRYELHGSTFTIEGRELMLRERLKPKPKQTKYYLLAVPGGYVSSLWPQRDGRYRIDYTAPGDVERMYYITFDGAYVVIENGGISRRSGSTAPWLRSTRAS